MNAECVQNILLQTVKRVTTAAVIEVIANIVCDDMKLPRIVLIRIKINKKDITLKKNMQAELNGNPVTLPHRLPLLYFFFLICNI